MMKRFHAVLLICLLGFNATFAPLVVAAEFQNFIVQNVHIIKQGGETGTDLGSLRIKNGNLDLVSNDQIAADDEMQILDAKEGFLLGNLTVGAAPKFMILSKDPVSDLSVLLDTKQYVVFAIDGSQVLANELQQAAADAPDPSTEEKKPRWLSYSPPPFALPTTIDSSKKWNTWKSKYVNGIFISALALDRQWLNQDENSIGQFGDLSENYERGTIRGWRFGVAGTLNFKNPWVYNIAWAWNSFDRGFESDESDELQFFDFAVDIPLGKNMTVTVGKQKEPINMDRSMTMVTLASQERYAAADGMFPSRNVGVVVSGTVADRRVSWAGGLFNDWLTEGERLDDSATQAVGRVTWLPIISEDESNVLHLGLGIRYTDAKQGLKYGSRPETGNAPRFVDTGKDVFAAESSTLYNWEAGWRSGPYWLMAEYSDNHIDAPSVGNPNFTGYHISGTWSLSGEMRPYLKSSGVFRDLPIAQNVNQGGWGAWEVGLRFSSIDLTEGLIEGGEMDIATAQINWWATKSLMVSANYRRTWTDRLGLDGEMDALVFRVALLLQ